MAVLKRRFELVRGRQEVCASACKLRGSARTGGPCLLRDSFLYLLHAMQAIWPGSDVYSGGARRSAAAGNALRSPGTWQWALSIIRHDSVTFRQPVEGAAMIASDMSLTECNL